jgi:hypothetical protein
MRFVIEYKGKIYRSKEGTVDYGGESWDAIGALSYVQVFPDNQCMPDIIASCFEEVKPIIEGPGEPLFTAKQLFEG